MDDLQTILALKAQVEEEIRRAQERLKALEVVEKMIRDAAERAKAIPIRQKLYKEMKQDDAIQDILRRSLRKLTATEIAKAMQDGGYVFQSKTPSESIYSTMHHNTKGLYVRENVGNRTVFGLAGQQPKAGSSNRG